MNENEAQEKMSEVVPGRFAAFRIHSDDRGYRSGLEDISLDQLSPGEVTIRVEWSGLNFKDALAATGKAQILRDFPLVGGIDVAGTVIASDVDAFEPGDAVLANGSGLSETRDGGFCEYLRLHENNLVSLPEGLTTRQAMGLGTAGFTAALCLYRMEANGLTPDKGPVVVTGASGGVGSLAINIFSTAGYEVHAITSKLDRFDWLQKLGAKQCISSHELHWGQKPLERASWAAAVDTVGGDMLSGLSRVIKPWGNIACCGMAAGAGFSTTVFPLIVRGISVLGISSANCPISLRRKIWKKVAADWNPPGLNEIITREVGLQDIGDCFEAMLNGESTGRTVVKIA